MSKQDYFWQTDFSLVPELRLGTPLPLQLRCESCA